MLVRGRVHSRGSLCEAHCGSGLPLLFFYLYMFKADTFIVCRKKKEIIIH